MKITWYIEVSESINEISALFDNIDSSIFSNREFMRSLWNDTYKKISEFIQKRFEEGKSEWKPLSPKYLKWKVSAARQGKVVNVGQFGKRVCQLTALGRLTDTMYPSATEKRFANIFDVKDEGGPNNSFRYAISGSKLPYAIYFDNVRPFFYLTDQEANQVLDILGEKIMQGVTRVWNG